MGGLGGDRGREFGLGFGAFFRGRTVVLRAVAHGYHPAIDGFTAAGVRGLGLGPFGLRGERAEAGIEVNLVDGLGDGRGGGL